MADQRDLLEIIEDGYDKRARGDKAAVAAFWALGATYRLVGDQSLLQGFPGGPAEESTAAIIDLVKFHDYRRLDAVVEGRSAAVRWQVTVSVGGGQPVATELYDLWRFDDAGKVTSLIQFTDTALLAKLLADYG